ncbi:MAG: hypothetical protein ACFFDD_12060 [Promethearchaeota archaeon]
MEKDESPRWVKVIVAVLFILLTALFVITAFSGTAWIIIDLATFSFWLTILTIGLAVSAMAVSTYSFVAYVQSREIRHLMLILLGVDIVLWSFLFLITHPSSELWAGVISDRDRNRTFGMALVLAVVPSILLGSFAGEIKPKKSIKNLLVIWGALIIPLINLWLFLSPEPVFIMVSEIGGVEGLTLIGGVISIGYLASQIIALLRFLYKWWKTRNIFDLTLLLALGLWTIGTGFIIVLWNPLQIAELLWMASVISGFLLIGSVQFITSILEPHRFLERLVTQRTRELRISKQESEFYLNMWTHKMGNLLQAMITYLDILELAAQNSEDDTKTRAAASDLTREAAMVNQQVVQLTRIKESLHQTLWPVNLPEAVEDAIKSAKKLLGEDAFTSEIIHQGPLTVRGDNLLPLAFHSVIAFQVKNRLDELPHIKVSVADDDSPRSIELRCRGKPVPQGLRTFIEGEELRGQIALDLDLFTIKLLMNRYGAKVRFGRDESTEENLYNFTFPPE